MNTTPVKSSNVRSIGYDEKSQTLTVEFVSGSLYRYSGVSVQTYAALMSATSIGSFVAHQIKGIYPHEKLEPADAEAK